MTDWKNPPKLFIPGPVHVLPEVLEQMARPTLGHRLKEYTQLHGEVAEMLKKILDTDQHIFLSTSSASGIWEACIRNCVQKDETVLCTMCGAFSDKFASVTKACGRQVEELKVEWGQAITAEMIDAKMATGKYPILTIVYNETSTGLTNPVYEISEMMKEKYPDVLVFVDVVSGVIGLPLHFDELGWDVAFASVQKAFAIPPGFAIAAVSNRAVEKSATVPERGYYFDFQQFVKAEEKNQTPTTPSIPHIMALHYKCNMLLEEGMENVWKRHQELADYVRTWGADQGFDVFPQAGYESNTLTAFKNTRGIDIAAVNKGLQEKHNTVFGNGYGKLKDKTFRIAHMGDCTIADLEELLGWIEDEIN
ncbi:MAG: alanine--glyoxylate aminotransferase family protein [Phycisphaerae bacterium]|nr:alanine--glyoxylate aminotransferase family protein [Phycisphaerae bacterium]